MAEPKQGEKFRMGFIAKLFGLNWQFVDTCESSVCLTSLRKK